MGMIAIDEKVPVHTTAEKDPFYASEQFKGWFAELQGQGRGADRDADASGGIRLLQGLLSRPRQEALLGDITPQQLADQWAKDEGQQVAR